MEKVEQVRTRCIYCVRDVCARHLNPPVLRPGTVAMPEYRSNRTTHHPPAPEHSSAVERGERERVWRRLSSENTVEREGGGGSVPVISTALEHSFAVERKREYGEGRAGQSKREQESERVRERKREKRCLSPHLHCSTRLR